MKVKLLALAAASVMMFAIAGCTSKVPGTTVSPTATVTVSPTVSPKA